MKAILLMCALMVAFSVSITNAEPGGSSPAEALRVTGRLLSVNDVTEVPAGLFGVHATPLNAERIKDWGIEAVRLLQHVPGGIPVVPGQSGRVPAEIGMVVECFWDRYQPALMLSNPDNWEEQLKELARKYGENARTTGIQHHIEFWNEPYLNWANRPGVNYDKRYYELADAAEGAPMRIRGMSEPVEHLVWSRQVRTVHADSGRMDNNAYLAHAMSGHRRKAGEEFEFRGRRFRNEEMWWGRDPTQKHYWSGQQNSLYYRRMLEVFGRELKRVNPQVQLAAGWDFHINSHGWDAWYMLYQPMIDAAVEWIDGVTEHHYGGDTRMVAGAYETVYTYTMGRYGKALKFYNTECGGMLDPEQPGNARNRAEGDAVTKALGGMTYALRDIIHLLDMLPDKAVARAAHDALSWSGGGDAFAFRMLRDLRGELLEVNGGSSYIWSVAALNTEQRRMAVVIFNDRDEPVEVPVHVAAPSGMQLKQGTMRSVVKNDSGLELEENPLSDVADQQWSGVLSLAGKHAVSLVFELEGIPPAGPEVLLSQYVSGEIINRVEPGQTVELEIKLPPEKLAKADGAFLRLVYGWSAGKAELEINGTVVERKSTDSWINQQPLDVGLLEENNTVTLRCDVDASGGFELNAASIILRTSKEQK